MSIARCMHPLSDACLAPAAICGGKIDVYRQCGRGCNIVIAYCTEHGGDERSQAEMRAHHDTHGEP